MTVGQAALVDVMIYKTISPPMNSLDHWLVLPSALVTEDLLMPLENGPFISTADNL